MKFILNTITAFDEPPRSRHQVAYELKNYGEVYFITRNKVGFPKWEVYEEDGIKFIIPYWPIDYRYRYRLPIINESYQKYLSFIFKKLNLKNEILVNFDHTAYMVTKNFDVSIYFCSDDHIGNSDINITAIDTYHTKTEKELSKRSSFCVATSEFLHKKLLQYNKNSYLLLLGAPDINEDVTQYHSSQDKGKINVFYVGYMQDRRINDKILNQILDQNNFELHVIGIVDDKYREILKDKAVMVGVKTGDELYQYIKKMDVGIMPYDLNGVNRGGTPNKYWLYTATGKPSVSVPLENILNWPTENGLLYIAEEKDFIDKIRLAFQEDSLQKFEGRLQYANNNRWTDRIKELLSLIEEHKPSKIES